MDGAEVGALSVASWVTADSSSPLSEDARTGKVVPPAVSRAFSAR
jgi:hypothetical protein